MRGEYREDKKKIKTRNPSLHVVKGMPQVSSLMLVIGVQ